MKNLVKLAAVAAVAGLATTPVLADGPTLYGKANISYQYNSNEADDTDHWELQSNASRLGVKGDVEMNETLSGFYKFEYEVAIDDGDPVFKQRNIIGGIKGGFGKVFFGTHDTPSKIAGKKIDMFNDYKLGDIKTTLEGENREKNTLSYKSPKFGPGLQGWVMLIPGEETGDGADNGPADAFSGSLVFDNKSLYAALSFDSDVDGEDTSLIRGAVQGKFGPAKVGVLLQSFDDGSDEDILGFAISAAFKLPGNNTLKAQVSGNDTEDEDPVMFSIGIDHKFTKKSKVYAFVTSYSDDNDANDADTAESSFAIGLEHKF